jgi:hypothetical protein
MNDDQLYYFLVDKNTRNVLQIEYPSDIDEFNKILGTSEGKGSLLKDLGIILSNETRLFSNPTKKITTKALPKKELKIVEATVAAQTKTTTKVKNGGKPAEIEKVNLFAGLFD